MAVTKSRRLAGWSLIATLLVTIAICLVFFFGGSNMEEVEGYRAYNFTWLLLGWVYIVLCLALLTTIVFSIIGFAKAFRKDAKKATRGLLGVIGIIILLVVTYVLGNGDTNSLKMLSDDSQKYMTPFWLKITDMVLYSCYALLGFSFVALIWGEAKRAFSKKH